MKTPQVFLFDTRVHGWRDASAALPAGGLWFKINSSQNGVEKFRQALSDLNGLLIADDVEYDVAPPCPPPDLDSRSRRRLHSRNWPSGDCPLTSDPLAPELET